MQAVLIFTTRKLAFRPCIVQSNILCVCGKSRVMISSQVANNLAKIPCIPTDEHT